MKITFEYLIIPEIQTCEPPYSIQLDSRYKTTNYSFNFFSIGSIVELATQEYKIPNHFTYFWMLRNTRKSGGLFHVGSFEARTGNVRKQFVFHIYQDC